MGLRGGRIGTRTKVGDCGGLPGKVIFAKGRVGRAIDRNGLKSPMKMVNGELFAGTVGWKLFFLKIGLNFSGFGVVFWGRFDRWRPFFLPSFGFPL